MRLQVGVTVPGDNSIDVLTNDVAVVVISNDLGEVEVGCIPADCSPLQHAGSSLLSLPHLFSVLLIVQQLWHASGCAFPKTTSLPCH